MRARVIANTGWTWDEAGRLTLPRLKALEREWARHPPTHLLVAEYLGFEPPADDDPEPVRRPRNASDARDDAPDPTQLAQMAGMGSIPASEDLSNARTPLEGLVAVERMFFGTLVEL